MGQSYFTLYHYRVDTKMYYVVSVTVFHCTAHSAHTVPYRTAYGRSPYMTDDCSFSSQHMDIRITLYGVQVHTSHKSAGRYSSSVGLAWGVGAEPEVLRSQYTSVARPARAAIQHTVRIRVLTSLTEITCASLDSTLTNGTF